MRTRNQYVFEKMLNHRIPTVIFMGGGYSKPIEHTIDAFYDLFKMRPFGMSVGFEHLSKILIETILYSISKFSRMPMEKMQSF